MYLYVCNDSAETTSGQMLFNGSIYEDQVSCRAATGNVGNYYSWTTATASGRKSSGNENNSICPTGWRLPVSQENEIKGWHNLFLNIYGVSANETSDSSARYYPISFLRSGAYDNASPNYRSTTGMYWSSTASGGRAYRFAFSSEYFTLQYEIYKYYGYSVRCVSR